MKITLEDLDGTKYTAEISNPHITEVVHAVRALLLGYSFGIKTIDEYIPDPDSDQVKIDAVLLGRIWHLLEATSRDLRAWLDSYGASPSKEALIEDIVEVLQKLENHQ